MTTTAYYFALLREAAELTGAIFLMKTHLHKYTPEELAKLKDRDRYLRERIKELNQPHA